jgi:hypothetical protein
MVTDNILENEFIDHIHSMGIWNEVITINEKNQPFQIVEKQIRDIYSIVDFDCIHIFTVGTMSSHLTLHLANKTAKVILTDGSVFTKMPIVIYNNWKNATFEKGVLPDNWIEFDFKRINEVQLLEADSFDGSIDVPVKNINICELWLSNEINMMDELNKLFKFTFSYNQIQFIYCASYRAMARWISYSYEEHFTKRLMELINGERCLIKFHPHSDFKEQHKRFMKYSVTICEDNDIPFELIFLNLAKKSNENFSVLTEFSSISTNLMILKAKLDIKNAKIIEMIAVQKQFNLPGEIDPYLKNLNVYNRLYKNNVIEVPLTWKELEECLEGGNTVMSNNDQKQYINDMDLVDYKFMKNDYIDLLKENNKLKRNMPQAFKFKKYYEVLNDFLRIKNRGDSINRFFIENQINSVLIYGHGNIAERLAEDIEIKVLGYLITGRIKDEDNIGIPIITPEDLAYNPRYLILYKSIDAIIITPVFDQEAIKMRLGQLRINKPIILIDEIIKYLEI